MRLHLGECANQIGRFGERRAARHIRAGAHFCGNHMRKRRLTKPRWTMQKHMLHRFAATLGRFNSNANSFNEITLTNVFINAHRAKRTGCLLGVSGLFCCRNDAFACHANKIRQN